MTSTGVKVLIAGVGLMVAGRLLGLAEIAGLGITTWCLVAIAIVAARIRRPQLRCTRELGALRTVAGEEVGVHLAVTRIAAGHSPEVTLHDPILRPCSPPSTAHRHVDALAAGETSTASYRLRVDQRGICRLGTMTIEVNDPFGLARRTHRGAGPVQLVVLPRISPVAPPRVPVEDDTRSIMTPSLRQGSEFASLREYVPGDDLRRVHWRTSARRDDLVVRHDEEPHRRGCTVILDVCDDSYDQATFERAVSATASILVAAVGADQPARLRTTAGFDSARGSGRGHLDLVLGELAVVQTASVDAMAPLRDADPVIVITTSSGVPGVRAALGTPRPGSLAVVFSDDDTLPVADAAPGLSTVVLGPREPFAPAWNRIMDPARSGEPVAARAAAT